MRKARAMQLAHRLRAHAELLRGPVPPADAAAIAAADHGPAEPAVLSESLPVAMPNTRALLADVGPDEAPLLHAAADVLESRGEAAPGWTLLAFTLAVAGVMIVVFSLFVEPALREIADALRQPLPMVTTVVFAFARWVLLPLIVLAMLAGAARRWLPARAGALRERLDGWAPFDPMGPATRTRLLAGWLAATEGRGDLAARLGTLEELAGAGPLRRDIGRLAAAVRQGVALPDALRQPAWLPGLALLLRLPAADAGPALRSYAAALDLRSEAHLARAVLVAQLVVGLVVGLLVVAMYLPLFVMGQAF